MIYVEFGCRIVLAMVFIFAAASKLSGRRDLAEFREAVVAFGIAVRWSWLVAASIVALEFAVAVLVLFDLTAVIGLCMTALLLICFSVAIALALRRGVSTSCRCFGASTRLLGPRHIVRNGILLLIVLVASAEVLLSPTTATPPDRSHPAFMMLAAFAAAVCALLIIAYDDLLALIYSAEAENPS